ncbi:MAG: methyltransferase domain-containing protein [Xenophilus sp.]
MNPTLHDAARQGFSREAGTYARGRPDYPAPVLDWLRDTLALRPGRTALDVGAGTGKFTALLECTGAAVVAVEPVDAMRARLQEALPAVRAVVATADAVPLPDATADAVVCAQAFHWFASGEALREFHRLLRPGGRLGLVWNVRDETVDWVARLTRIITPYEGDAPRFHKGEWRRPLLDSPLFGPLEETRWPHAHTGAPEDVIVGRFMSVSFIAALPGAGRDRVRGELEALIATHPDLRGRGEVSFPYTTLAFSARRLPG